MTTSSRDSRRTGAESGGAVAAATRARTPSDEVRAQRWGLISNHGAALGVLARDPNVTVREVAQAVGVTERSATNILRDLRDAGFVDVRRVGRRNYYSVKLEQKLRKAGYRESTVGELLAALHAMIGLDAEADPDDPGEGALAE